MAEILQIMLLLVYFTATLLPSARQEGISNPLDVLVEDFNSLGEGLQEHDVIHLIW